MRIGVVSDTHMITGGLGLRKLAAQVVSKNTQGLDYLEEVLEKHFRNRIERIFHAGDIADRGVIDLLEEFAPVDAVIGNMDVADLRQSLPIKRVIEIEGRRIGLIHGWGSPTGIIERIRKEFDDVHAIVFGHTHTPANQTMDNIFFFNPGSPIDRRFAPYRSIGILSIEPEFINGEIIKLD